MNTSAQSYQEFIASKIAVAEACGFEIHDSEINPICKPHQRDCIRFAVHGGKRAIFAAFGLGKSIMQLECLRIISAKEGCEALIVCPLGVRGEFKRDAQMLGIDTHFIRSADEMDDILAHKTLPLTASAPRVWLTNYESMREGKLDTGRFGVISLDEAAILRGFGGTKTFRELMRQFEGTSTYRFVATATPSPNEFIELLSYAAFLGIMEVSEAKTRFFKRDSTNADNLTLHPHKAKEFWLWCASWAIFLQKPSDLGYSDEGYSLPELDIRWHELPSDHRHAKPERNGQSLLLCDSTISVQNAAAEKRASLSARIEKLMELRAEDLLAHRIIWHDLEDERKAIEAVIPTVASVYGNRDLEEREQDIIGFSNGTIPELAAKPSMAGSGCNFQRHCAWAIFLGIGFRFAEFIQAIHRIHRFLQTKRVRIDLIYTEGEREMRRRLERKWSQHKIVVEEMSKIIREFGLAHESIRAGIKRTLFKPEDRQEQSGENWKLVNNDTILELPQWSDNSIHLVLTSIPFATQYEYTPTFNDLGHNEDTAAFWRQMDFLTPELSLRKLGFVLPLYCTPEDEILSGHQRHLAAAELGWDLVPVVYVPKKKNVFEKGLNLVFNRCTNDVAKETTTQEMWAEIQRAIDAGALDLTDIVERYACMYATDIDVQWLIKHNDITQHRYARNMAKTARLRGVNMPIVVSAGGELINGAGRLWVAVEEGDKTIKCVIVDDSRKEFARAMLNRLSMDFEVKEKYQDILRANAFRRKNGVRPYLGQCSTYHLTKGKPCHTFDIKDANHRAAWTRMFGTVVCDFGAGLMDESRLLCSVGIKSVPFEPYVCGESDTPDLEESRRVVRNFLHEIGHGYQFHSVFASAILNSIPFIEDRRHVLRIIATLCGRRTTFYTHCVDQTATRFKALVGAGSTDKAMEDTQAFMIGYEPNTSIGDIAEFPKVQKYHEPQELQSLLLERWAAVQVESHNHNLFAVCRNPRPVDIDELTRALEFEFDLPHQDGQRLGLVEEAKAAWSKRLCVTIR